MVTMTAVGLDVHARSTQATSVDMVTGEVSRARLSGDADQVVAFLAGLPGPVRACYEAGPTGFGLARAARAAGIDLEVRSEEHTCELQSRRDVVCRLLLE